MIISKEIRMILQDFIGVWIGKRFWWKIGILYVRVISIKKGDKCE
jgi:hypothetical protein